MEHITKVFFDPLATTKSQIRAILEELPVGSAHPFSPERILLYRTNGGVDEIDISSYKDDFFFSALDLGELGESLQARMSAFQQHIGLFNDEYTIQQAPAATFEVPLVSDKITIFAVSARKPTYYDLCMGEEGTNTSCYGSIDTFIDIKHSGDINQGGDLLHYFKFGGQMPSDKPYTIFVSGYSYTKLTKYQQYNPVVLVANHTEKVLYIVPVPLDAASIGDATICNPLVIKRSRNSIICSILPTPTTDVSKMCTGSTLQTLSFKEAIQRANFTVSALPRTSVSRDLISDANVTMDTHSTAPTDAPTQRIAVLATHATSLPPLIQQEPIQIIRFGAGIYFEPQGSSNSLDGDKSTVVLPCIFGSRLEGPMLLATGAVPSNVPFTNEIALRNYYKDLECVVVLVDERMTDNARNMATPWRINALFIVQVTPEKAPSKGEISSLLDSVNINAVTALAGPQSLILIHISGKYYFYRGIANQKYLDTSNLPFGLDITVTIESTPPESLLDPRAKRLVNLNEANACILPSSGETVQSQDLKKFFQNLSLAHLEDLEDDISALVPQLQVLLNQTELAALSKELISILSSKVENATTPMRTAYIKFLTKEYKASDPQMVKQRSTMLGEYRKATKRIQKNLGSIITHLSNMMSSQTTSKRTHDLKRLVRQTAIQNNVAAVQDMTFETLAGLLETYAGDMGVLLLNIETTPYRQLLGNLKNTSLDVGPCCNLDSRVLFLEGFDAGIIIEQSQANHVGPLKHQLGPTHPILALPYLNQERGAGSMLAWVCWDEFVDLENPFTVRWMEKCNDSHIAALRIIMRDTLSRAVASREFDLQPGAIETGQLMAALLMGAMSKLAAMRTTLPTVTIKAEDTVTKLMRGLFGNLLTTAGSGVRPMSMVWQLFVSDPNFDVPSTETDWRWYEQVVSLYSYTGWPQEQFLFSLEKLLDKVVIRVVTKNENTEQLKLGRAAAMIKFCKLRNIQLSHSRTIITIFTRMLTEEVDRKSIAKRLINALPQELEKESESYTRMIKYLKHLSKGGKRRADDDRVAACVYTKRSATFGELKKEIAKSCRDNDIEKIKTLCEKIMAKQDSVAELWGIKSKNLHVQNIDAYKGLLETTFGDDIDEETKSKNKAFFKQVINDAEPNRVPWQVGNNGEFGDDIEPIDEGFVHEIMTGENPSIVSKTPDEANLLTGVDKVNTGLTEFSSIVKREFITQLEGSISPADVCKITGVPFTSMRVFVKALNPAFEWERLGRNFKGVVISLLKERKDREGSRPARRLFDMYEQNWGS